MLPALADSHCHLDFDELAGDFDAVMARARAAGVRRFVTIGVELQRHERALAIAAAHDDVFVAVGTHPHWTTRETVSAEALVACAAHPKVVGIGESGLDRLLTDAPFDLQQSSFARHIEAAQRCGLPLIVHSVGADAQTGAMLSDAHRRQPLDVVMHCFSGGRDLAHQCIELGYHLSFSGLLTYEGRDELRAIAAALPASCLLIETDSPSLAPAPIADQRNEPANLRLILRELARLRRADEAELAAQIASNFSRAFRKVPSLQA